MEKLPEARFLNKFHERVTIGKLMSTPRNRIEASVTIFFSDIQSDTIAFFDRFSCNIMPSKVKLRSIVAQSHKFRLKKYLWHQAPNINSIASIVLVFDPILHTFLSLRFVPPNDISVYSQEIWQCGANIISIINHKKHYAESKAFQPKSSLKAQKKTCY